MDVQDLIPRPFELDLGELRGDDRESFARSQQLHVECSVLALHSLLLFFV